MSGPTQTCQACGAALQIDGQRATCTNENCPGGGLYIGCGYCSRFSLAVMSNNISCINPDCRMYKQRREECPHCKKVSRIQFSGQTTCINRGCPSNADQIDMCFFCQMRDGAAAQKSFLSQPELGICSKGNCSHLLVRVTGCPHCEQRAYNLKTEQCDNPQCSKYHQTFSLSDSVVGATTSSADELKSAWDTLDQPDPTPAQPALTPAAAPADTAPSRPGEKRTTKFTFGHGDASGGDSSSQAAAPPPAATPPAQPDTAQPDAGAAAKPEPPAAPARDPWAPVTRDPDTPAPTQAVEVPAMTLQADASGLPGSGAPAPAPAPSPALEASDQDAMPGGDDVQQLRSSHGAQPPPVQARALASGRGQSLLSAFKFIRRNLLQEGEKTFPLYLVIGLAGAGKTTYLTMLGQILKFGQKKYHFPYPDIGWREFSVRKILERQRGQGRRYDADEVAALQQRVKDLIFDFSSPQFTDFISKMMWANSTMQEDALGEDEGDEEIRTYFLVSELTRKSQVFARLITVETSGEDYEKMIEGLRADDPGGQDTSPMQHVLFEMLDLAEGFVVLVSPDRASMERNDEILTHLFLRIRQHLEPRAMQHYYAEVNRRLDPGSESNIMGKVRDIQASAARAQRRQEARKARIGHWKSLLDTIYELLLAGDEDVFEQHRSDLTELGSLIGEAFPDRYEKAKVRFDDGEKTVEDAIEFYQGMCHLAREQLSDIVDAEEKRSGAHEPNESDAAAEFPPELQKALDKIQEDIRDEYGLQGFDIALNPSLREDDEPTRLLNLKNLSIVITKSDMYPIIYPPSQFPEKKLDDSALHLQHIDNFLRLCGGRIRYYNSSATGYSLMRDTRYYPGKENTLTPINIIEPIFDMMDIE